MPTNSVTPLRIMRAAAMVIISSAVYDTSDMTGGPSAVNVSNAALELAEILGAEHVAADPRLKRLPIPGDNVPSLVECVVTLIITLRVGGKRASPHFEYRAQHPCRQHHRIRRCVQ